MESSDDENDDDVLKFLILSFVFFARVRVEVQYSVHVHANAMRSSTTCTRVCVQTDIHVYGIRRYAYIALVYVEFNVSYDLFFE